MSGPTTAPPANPAAASGGADGEGGRQPAWARELQQRQALAHGTTLALHAAASGDAHGGGANPSLSEDR